MGKTVQGETVYRTVVEHPVHPTAEQVFDWVRKELPSVGLATVYRNLEKLSAEGRLLRIPVADGPDRFDGNIDDHCHMLCSSCGRMVDMSDGFTRDLHSFMEEKGFSAEDYYLITRGFCVACQNKE